ncbi:MAG: hypothetical protein LBN22_03985 [Clostridiales Family XIII bacterium]|jgi:CRISPR-associated endonuclease/helicase Cas3|nr:hypothetical protein [Clostridiales Family XIII bacterium]
MELSAQARVLWAKSSQLEYGKWLPLYIHMSDSAEVADLLWYR